MGKSNYTKPKMAAEIENKFRRAEMGVVDYSTLLVKGNVGFNYPLELHCTGAPRAKPIRVDLNIGPCSPGEAIVQAKKTCAPCPVGTYSTKGLSCLPCPYGAECVSEKMFKNEYNGKSYIKVVGSAWPSPMAGFWMSYAPRSLVDGTNTNSKFWDQISDPSSLAPENGDTKVLRNVEEESEGRRLDSGKYANNDMGATDRRAAPSSSTEYCDWTEGYCMPGVKLDPVEGCVALKNIDAERQFACTEGLQLYTCPSREHACAPVKNYQRNGTAADPFSSQNCQVGYRGFKCFQCETNYFKTSDGLCQPCVGQGTGGRENAYLFYGVSAGISFIGFSFLLYCYLRRDDGKYMIKRIKQCLGVHTRRKRKRHHHNLRKSHSSSYADLARASMWFRPEKFKILLSFVQIFSQMKNNYGIPWSSLTAEYMRIFSGFNVDVVKIAAVDCLYRTNFYFGLIVACGFPLATCIRLFLLSRFGRQSFISRLKRMPRKCVRTGDVLAKWMPYKNYMELQKKAARKSLENDHIDDDEQMNDPKALKRAMKEAMGHNVSGLPPGTSISEAYWNTPGIIKAEHLEKVVRYNIRMWGKRILERMEYIRFKSKLWKLFFWTLLLCYPSVAIRILRVFACEEIGGYLVLSEDLTLRCFSARWFVYASVATTAGMLFIVGIPLLFLVVLISARDFGIKKRWKHCLRFPDHRAALLKEAKEDADVLGHFWTLDRDGDGQHSLLEEKHAIYEYLRRKNMRNHRNYERIGFIYYSYREEVWWYEIVELSRKLILNGCMVLIAEGLVTRVVAGVLVCFVYLVLMNHFPPYTCMSDFSLQNVCHIQLFFVVFAGLMIKGKVPYLGFESYYRPIEQKIVEVVVIASHACTLAYGIGSIIWEKFYSKEQRLIKALEKKNTNLRKQRMKKFSRARKNLMAGIRGNLAMKKNGGGLGAVVSGVGAKNKGEKKSVGLDFEWPQNGKVERQVNTDKKSGSSSEESEVDLDHWSSDSYAGSEVDHNDSDSSGSASSSAHSETNSSASSISHESDHGDVDFNRSDDELKQ